MKAAKKALLTQHEKDILRVQIVARCMLVGDCWVFTGPLSTSGYGRIKVNLKWVTTSRYMLAYSTRESLNIALDACHALDCPYKSCCNPLHLFWGTHSENCKMRWQNDRLDRTVDAWGIVGPPRGAYDVHLLKSGAETTTNGQGVDVSVP
jgi:hypothetical protein